MHNYPFDYYRIKRKAGEGLLIKETAASMDGDEVWQDIFKACEYYMLSCQVGCRVIDTFGSTLFVSNESAAAEEICTLAAAAMPGHNQTGDTCSQQCKNAHLYGCYQAERFGGQYVYFCPLGLTHWASPIMRDQQVVGAILGGPVHMIDPVDFLIDDWMSKHELQGARFERIKKLMRDVPVISTERVNAMSHLLYLTASALSDDSIMQLKAKKESGDIQSDLWDQISFIKSYIYKSEEELAYPIEKEDQLLELIEVGDKQGSQKVLNEIMGHIFFSSSGSIEVMRARVMELVVLLSRAAIRGGADVMQIFGLNYTYLNKISQFRNIDEIAYWLSAVMARFTDQVFNLTNVKHADVIYQAVNYIRQNYMKKITLEETAAHVFLSPAYFSRVFKEEMKDNFNIYVNQIRIEAAKKLLLNEKIPLVDISTTIGFEGQSYFSKVFKKMTGTTPGKYRESRGKIKPSK